ncbi:tigger transposable element-derived protein 1-like [Portunus trituberculatus]|uniref:tigger transposable element-derived protein 1-like n=1 Tax=Portunus trituberculatus TaxID=210409 RepID=UPI001E1CF1D2|nr:tigger transposable element-derived protein 1-like [Portunus trituberculatus]
MDVKDVQFKASKGWFDRFQRQSNLYNVKVSGEAASADHGAAQKFKPELAKLIAEKGYSAKQVINYDETGLFWKKMSSKTYISKEEKHAKGFKAAKDRVTLLLEGNAEGDLNLKPKLIYHSENPRALKGLIKDYLPVVWRSNKKAWLTTTIHQDYFSSYLAPKLTEYASANNIANRFLLILDNALSHPKCMEDWAENIQVVFLPPNTTSLIQPMDQTIIKTFKVEIH